MAPKRPDNLSCTCRPTKPCFESIEKMIKAAKRAQQQDTGSEQNDDIRDSEPRLDIIPTVHCQPPEQSHVPAEYPGKPCFGDDESETKEKQDSERQMDELKRKYQDAAARSKCPCDACGKDSLFQECANPFIEFERIYAKGGEDLIPEPQIPHDCREHRDRPRDRAPGDSDTDFVPKPCTVCPCCLAFRPHPPATLATTDLYRTCGLPKRFKYPVWFKGYGNCRQNPLYRTTSSDIGRYPPTIHTVPTIFRTVDRSLSKLIVPMGPYKDKGLRTTGSIWDAYTYFDF